MCRIEGMVVEAEYDLEEDPFTVRCATPIFLRIGLVDVELSLDGESTFNFTGRISVGELLGVRGHVLMQYFNCS